MRRCTFEPVRVTAVLLRDTVGDVGSIPNGFVPLRLLVEARHFAEAFIACVAACLCFGDDDLRNLILGFHANTTESSACRTPPARLTRG